MASCKSLTPRRLGTLREQVSARWRRHRSVGTEESLLPQLPIAQLKGFSRQYACGGLQLSGLQCTISAESPSSAFAGRIVDAAYSTMVRAIREERTPNLFALHYEPEEWRVANLILIPHFAFPLSAIEKRKPLGPNARRAGWVGCNILLSAIPLDARIPVIAGGKPATAADVRAQYARIRPLEALKAEQRGWTLDVLNVVRSLGKAEFNLSEVYAFESKLAHLHPDNRHVRDKIRQQLQVLRDLGLLQFLGGGDYRMR